MTVAVCVLSVDAVCKNSVVSDGKKAEKLGSCRNLKALEEKTRLPRQCRHLQSLMKEAPSSDLVQIGPNRTAGALDRLIPFLRIHMILFSHGIILRKQVFS